MRALQHGQSVSCPRFAAASGFYEWIDHAGRRRPIRFEFEDERLFCFAGLFFVRDGAESFAIITVPANEYVRKVHTRMPLIVAAADFSLHDNSG